MTYTEKLEIGYRWFDAHKETPLFEFGAGLSYSTFEWSDLKATASEVSCTVKNSGKRTGSTVAQLYLEFPEEAVYNYAFKVMDFVFKVMDSLFKMMSFGRRSRLSSYGALRSSNSRQAGRRQ